MSTEIYIGKSNLILQSVNLDLTNLLDAGIWGESLLFSHLPIQISNKLWLKM